MKLNNIPCLNYDVGANTATLTLATTDLEEIKNLDGSETMMLYDGVDNPLLSLYGFDHIISIKVLLEEDASEVVFGKTDTTILSLRAENAELRERLEALTDIVSRLTENTDDRTEENE